MRIRNSIWLLLTTIITSACSQKKYAVTTYFTNFDSSITPSSKVGKNFKYSYEEFNSDSSIIYQEIYGSSSTLYNEDMWGKLLEKTKFSYKDKNKVRAEIEYGTPYSKSDKWRERGKYVNTYQYVDNKLTKWISDGKTKEEYFYNKQNELEKKVVYSLEKYIGYEYYLYSNNLKIKTQFFNSDTLYSIDTFIYKNNRLIETNSFDSKGEMTSHRIFIRNDKGKVIEEKWKYPYLDWREGVDGKWVNAEFNQENKYFYDTVGRQLKTEYYRSNQHYNANKLISLYEFKYD